MTTTCFLDMDGVLVDFSGAVGRKFFGVEVDCWDFDVKIPGITKGEFWSSCDAGFWAGLPWTRDGREILGLVESTFGKENVCLLTSPCRTSGCMQGKEDWIKEHLPEYTDRFLMGRGKCFPAGPGKVLVDDNDGNIDAFVAGGGKGILIPRPWNKFNRWSTAVIPYLRDTLSLQFPLHLKG